MKKKSKSQRTTGRESSPSRERPVRRYEAIWLQGRVPSGFWTLPRNRSLYVRCLGQRLDFRTMEDWYQITTGDFKRNCGRGVLRLWNDCAIDAVKECFPNHDWKEWLFTIAPRNFWRDRKNHGRYMRWLGQQLRIRSPAG